jgi:hypothetical protein
MGYHLKPRCERPSHRGTAARIRKNKRSRPVPNPWPAWFHRATPMEVVTSNKDFLPADFGSYELSELSEDEEPEEASTCDCESSGDDCEECEYCECNETDSERGRIGSAAEYYYELKEDRDQEKIERNRDRAQAKEELLMFEKSKAHEVREAYKLSKVGRILPPRSDTWQ